MGLAASSQAIHIASPSDIVKKPKRRQLLYQQIERHAVQGGRGEQPVCCGADHSRGYSLVPMSSAML